WDINLDGQYVNAKTDNLDFGIHGSIFADQEVDLTGQYPVITPHRPLTLGLWTGVTPALSSASDQEYFTTPRYTFWRSAMDHIEHSRGHEWAFQGDAAYNFLNDGFLKQLKFGARYSDREQDIKYTTYNWGDISETWTGTVFMDQVGQPGGQASLYSFNNFFRGQTNAPPGEWYYNGVLNSLSGYDEGVAFAQLVQSSGGNPPNCGGSTAPNCNPTGGSGWRPLAQRAGVVPGTPFLPSEIQKVGQKTYNAYAMLRFGNDEPIFGNVKL